MSDIFLNLVNISITAGWIVIAVMILRLFLKKAPKWINCILWGIVGLRLIFPVSIESIFSLIPSKETINTTVNEFTPYVSTGFSNVDITVNEAISERYYEGITVPAGLFDDITSVLSVIWIIGLISMLAYALISFFKLHRKMRTSTPLSDNIRQSEFAQSPFILGIIKPKIYLPYSLTEDGMNCVIAHEQSHLKRLDHLWKPFAFLILSVYWFNPLMWAAYILLCRDIELACDEKVINKMTKEERQNYSITLVENSISRKSIAACPLAFGEVGVRERIKSVMSYKKPTLWIIIAAFIVCIVTSVCFLTNPKTDTLKFKNIEINSASVNDYEFSEAQKIKLREYLRGTTAEKDSKGNQNKNFAYSLNVNSKGKTPFILSGYMGSEQIVTYYQNKYYVIKNKDFADFLYSACVNGDNQSTSVGKQNIDALISQAVLNHYKSDKPTGLICVEDHIILSNDVKTYADDSSKIIEETVYAMVLYNEYSFVNGELTPVRGAHIPTALTFSVYDNVNYTLTEYWEPGDGIDSVKDIKKKFPKSIVNDALNTQKYVKQQEAACYKKAKAKANNMLGGDTSLQRINKLLNTIASTPKNSTNPKDNITAHPNEYKELLSYNNETLRFIYCEFLKGGQTDFRGRIMQEVMIDLLDGEAIKLHTDNGQEYFNAFLHHAKEIEAQLGHEYMNKYNYRAHMLLETANQ